MIMQCYYEQGKKTAMDLFDTVANGMIQKYGPLPSIFKISFLSGIMVPNGVLSKEESDELSKKYALHCDEIIKMQKQHN